LNALKHGFYSKHFQKSELQDLEEAQDLQEEIAMMRVVTRRLLKMARGCKELGELINVLGALGLAFFRSRSRQALRVAGLMKAQKYLGGNKNPFDEMMEKVIDDVTKD
jgi:hypothetical protein